MKLPKKKKILRNVWRISEVEQPVCDDGEVVYGLCDYDNKTLIVKKNLSKDPKLRTYFHEVLHASLFEIGIKLSDEEDERLVTNLEDIVFRLFKVTPK